MSPKKTNKAAWTGWLFSALLIVGSIWLWTERQRVVDTVQYYQYTPSKEVAAVTDAARLTDNARFTFYATHPVIESSESFNRHCERKEANSPILGCYSGNRIYIFNVTDARLEGIKTVTAAHELLHAEYDRLSSTEKKKLEPLLRAAYQSNTNSDLEARMAYYEKTEPGESINELHSIVGTEFTSISPELEMYYKKYFKNRTELASLHTRVSDTFGSLSEEADDLVNRIEKLASQINSATKEYNSDVQELNRTVEAFNERASRQGGFTTQSEFNAQRQVIIAQSNALNDAKQRIQQDIATHKTLIAQLDSINAQSAELNQSLDSTLSDAPKI